jgi:hypothetical protein
MERNALITMMLGALRATLADQGTGPASEVSAKSALVGAEAVVSSMGLVSFITDVESLLAQDFNLEVTLVSEQAFSRKSSPFRTIETLAEYVLELAGASNSDSARARQ